jgi:hypothetical protein
MTKFIHGIILIIAILVWQTIFAQDKALEKKVDKVVKIEKNLHKEETAKKECSEKDKIECCKNKKCCDKCTGDKCDGKCCTKCAECKKAGEENCKMGRSDTCAVDSTAKCKNHNMKNHMENKVINKETRIEKKK